MRALRWSLILPAIALCGSVPWLLYPIFFRLAIAACPHALRTQISTTDFSQPDYAITSDTCNARWFPTLDASLMVFVVVLAVLTAGYAGHRLPPSHKRISSIVSCLLVAGFFVAVFLHRS
jgi:hypothetical protein